MKTNALAKMLGVNYHHGMTTKEIKRKVELYNSNKINAIIKDKIKRIKLGKPLPEEEAEYLEIMNKINGYEIPFVESVNCNFSEYVKNRKTRMAVVDDFSDFDIIKFIKDVWK